MKEQDGDEDELVAGSFCALAIDPRGFRRVALFRETVASNPNNRHSQSSLRGFARHCLICLDPLFGIMFRPRWQMVQCTSEVSKRPSTASFGSPDELPGSNASIQALQSRT